jgi:DNA-binding response OmpR family regulator/anti-sigma regulatory factor (Ser/Thr protein kinase)
MNRTRRVLVVEDDHVSRSFLQVALTKYGYDVAAAENAAAAWEILSPAGIHTFDCVVTDYRMPDTTGLELLAWIQQRDPSLATIIITAEGEKDLVTRSLRGGATDFLDKPVALEMLHSVVATAVKRTRRQRHLDQSEAAVQNVGRAQERMLDAKVSDDRMRVEICFHPKHGAGGDFFSRFQPTPNHFCGLLTDVSGHDLQAAYISAYFQGIVRGMLERAVPMTEIFATFNRLLLEEWNQFDASSREAADIKTSIAACAISIDTTAQTATLLVQGMPAPVYWRPDGDAKIIGETGGFPLGWFPDLNCRGVEQPISGGGAFSFWTDGLGNVAEENGVSELSLACALQATKSRRQRLAETGCAADDILLAEVWLSSPHIMAAAFRPLLLEQYHGGQSGDIDLFQAYWQRSLRLAMPELPAAAEHDVLLAAREALLNALKHGCSGRPDQPATFQVACSPQSQTIRVRVDDFGPGHEFDCAHHQRLATADLPEAHRGLFLIKQLANRVDFQRGGASVTMDFTW